MSPRREGTSGRTAKVKTRANAGTTKPRWNVSRDLCARILMELSRKVVCFRQVTSFNTKATAKVFSKRRHRAIPRVSLALRGGTGKDHLESRGNRDIVVRSQKEIEKIKNSFMLMPAGKNNRPHRRRCGVMTARENLTAPLDLTVSQCDCARVWTASTVKPSNRGAEEIQRLRHNKPGWRGRTNHAHLWSERLETKDVEYAGESR